MVFKSAAIGVIVDARDAAKLAFADAARGALEFNFGQGLHIAI